MQRDAPISLSSDFWTTFSIGQDSIWYRRNWDLNSIGGMLQAGHHCSLGFPALSIAAVYQHRERSLVQCTDRSRHIRLVPVLRPCHTELSATSPLWVTTSNIGDPGEQHHPACTTLPITTRFEPIPLKCISKILVKNGQMRGITALLIKC